MAYTARELIIRAFYLSKVVSRQMQNVTGQQISDGLALLNALLEVKGSDLRLIPYFKRDTFNTVVGQEEYFRTNLLAVETLTFNYSNVRYQMLEQSRTQYFNASRANNIQTLPNLYHVEREKGGARIYLYPLPNNVYEMQLSGKFGLLDVTLNEDMALTYDLFYIEYLRYALAEYICAEYSQDLPELVGRKLAEITKKLMDVSPADLTGQKLSYFNSNMAINWGVVNLSNGWMP